MSLNIQSRSTRRWHGVQCSAFHTNSDPCAPMCGRIFGLDKQSVALCKVSEQLTCTRPLNTVNLTQISIHESVVVFIQMHGVQLEGHTVLKKKWIPHKLHIPGISKSSKRWYTDSVYRPVKGIKSMRSSPSHPNDCGLIVSILFGTVTVLNQKYPFRHFSTRKRRRHCADEGIFITHLAALFASGGWRGSMGLDCHRYGSHPVPITKSSLLLESP